MDDHTKRNTREPETDPSEPHRSIPPPLARPTTTVNLLDR